MNPCDVQCTQGWVYSVKEHAGPWPAETGWVSDGTAEPNAAWHAPLFSRLLVMEATIGVTQLPILDYMPTRLSGMGPWG